MIASVDTGRKICSYLSRDLSSSSLCEGSVTRMMTSVIVAFRISESGSNAGSGGRWCVRVPNRPSQVGSWEMIWHFGKTCRSGKSFWCHVFCRYVGLVRGMRDAREMIFTWLEGKGREFKEAERYLHLFGKAVLRSIEAHIEYSVAGKCTG